MTVTVGQVTALTVITRIKPGMTDKLRQVLRGIQTSPDRPLRRINSIHYARWVVIDEGTRLLFASNFDGTLDDYLKEFAEMAAEGLDAIWSNCEDYPGSRPVEPFIAYVRKHESEAALFYAAYPDVTVKQVQRAVAAVQKFQEFLDTL